MTDDTLTAATDDTVSGAAGSDMVLTGNDTTDDVGGSDTISGTGPRDERHDSIDRNTGTLTTEAAELRAEHGISQSGEQVPEGKPEAE